MAIVVVVIQVMVHVVSRAVHERLQRAGHAKVSVVDGNGPDVDGNVEQQVGELVHGEEEHVDVVGGALQEAVNGVEGMGGEGRGHLPDVVGLVDVLVDEAVVQPAVDPVDQAVREQDEGEGGPCQHPPTCSQGATRLTYLL